MLDVSVEQSGGQVSFSRIRKKGYDHLSGEAFLAGEREGGKEGGSGGYAHEQSFLRGEEPGRSGGVLIRDRNDLVDDGSVIRLRDKSRSDSLDLMASAVYAFSGPFRYR